MESIQKKVSHESDLERMITLDRRNHHLMSIDQYIAIMSKQFDRLQYWDRMTSREYHKYRVYMTNYVLPELLEWCDRPDDEHRRWHIMSRYLEE